MKVVISISFNLSKAWYGNGVVAPQVSVNRRFIGKITPTKNGSTKQRSWSTAFYSFYQCLQFCIFYCLHAIFANVSYLIIFITMHDLLLKLAKTYQDAYALINQATENYLKTYAAKTNIMIIDYDWSLEVFDTEVLPQLSINGIQVVFTKEIEILCIRLTQRMDWNKCFNEIS